MSKIMDRIGHLRNQKARAPGESVFSLLHGAAAEITAAIGKLGRSPVTVAVLAGFHQKHLVYTMRLEETINNKLYAREFFRVVCNSRVPVPKPNGRTPDYIKYRLEFQHAHAGKWTGIACADEACLIECIRQIMDGEPKCGAELLPPDAAANACILCLEMGDVPVAAAPPPTWSDGHRRI